ncbi:hypothetical protein [Streptomyces siamensis]|uniref:hypothetical protein n=1 Tax=Streptomyces siamensis TaxID=1274986 RepID=UPI0031E9C595
MPAIAAVLADARCTYAADWVATKLRWQLTVDEQERQALVAIGGGCGRRPVEYEPAPKPNVFRGGDAVVHEMPEVKSAVKAAVRKQFA